MEALKRNCIKSINQSFKKNQSLNKKYTLYQTSKKKLLKKWKLKRLSQVKSRVVPNISSSFYHLRWSELILKEWGLVFHDRLEVIIKTFRKHVLMWQCVDNTYWNEMIFNSSHQTNEHYEWGIGNSAVYSAIWN